LEYVPSSLSLREKDGLKHLLGLTLEELQQVAIECGMPKFTGKQIADWVYKKKVQSIDDMTNISVPNRAKLAEKYDVGRVAPIDLQRSVDGTVKYLFRINEKQTVEAVMIPEDDRSTLCVSSQIGCKFNCLFCMTGKQGFNGHLSVTDIINQVYSVEESDQLTNLVFMGMGEPLDNYDRVKKVIELLTADYALAWSPKRITLSTTGVTPKLKLFLEETSAHLAVSLHNPFPTERLKIMPAEKAFPIVEVMNLLKQYDWSKQRRLSFEYIMFNKLNDSIPFAKELVRLLDGIDCRVNLIRFHAIPDVDLKTSDNETMVKFRDYLTYKGVTCTIRSSRGEDIFAACGMLANVKQKENSEQVTSEKVNE
jgi:23S rRNA (adenine2503-C2)-methyltransferase